MSILNLSALFEISPPIKETNETDSSASFLDIYLRFDTNGEHSTRLYGKKEHFNLVMITFPQQLDSNISTDPAYGLYTSQLILDFDIMFLLRSSWQFVFRRYTTLLYSEH